MRNSNPSTAAAFTLGVWTLVFLGTAIPVSALAADVADNVTSLVVLKAASFSLEDVRLLDGPTERQQEIDRLAGLRAGFEDE